MYEYNLYFILEVVFYGMCSIASAFLQRWRLYIVKWKFARDRRKSLCIAQVISEYMTRIFQSQATTIGRKQTEA